MTPSKRFLIISLLIIFLSSVLIKPALAAGRQLEIHIPGLTTTELPALPDYIIAIYNFSLMAVGVICLGALIYGGFRYLTSAGSPAALSDAKDQIFSALLGLIILFSAWLILTTINPELIILNPTPGGGCHSDTDCIANYRCSGGTCVPYTPTQECIYESCPNDGQAWQCIAGYCTLPPKGWGAQSCDAHIFLADCTRDINCYWCPLCAGTKINKWKIDSCVNRGTECGYACVVGQCEQTTCP